MLLIDRALGSPWVPSFWQYADRPKWQDIEDRAKSELRSCSIFQVSNVANYLYLGTEQEEWKVFEDFPRPMPPFNRVWMEWSVPASRITTGGAIGALPLSEHYRRMGCLVICQDAPQGMKGHALSLMTIGEPKTQDFMAVNPIECLYLDENYEPRSILKNGNVAYILPTVPQECFTSNYDVLDELCNCSGAMAFPCMLALSLLNCRNVRTKEVAVDAALVKKHRKRGRTITERYSIIEIDPIIKSINRETGSTGYSRRAASIIRGHFKDYRNGNGLLGKIRGLFWWDQVVTGMRSPEYRLKAATGPLDDEWIKGGHQAQKP